MLGEIRTLYDYNQWANDRVLEATSDLGKNEFQRDLATSFISVQGTLAHILSAEWVWLRRWRGTSPSGIPDDWDLATHPAIRGRWREVEDERTTYLAGLTETALGTVLHYRNTAGTPFEDPLWQLLLHVVNHSTYHRGQITTLLRQLGHAAAPLDFVLFRRG